MNSLPPLLPADRFLPPDPARRVVARELYTAIAELPIISPHGHVDPRLLADEDATFGTPAELFVIRITTSSGCSTRRGSRSSRWGSGRATQALVRARPDWPSRPTTGESGRRSPTTFTCSGARRPGSGWPNALYEVFASASRWQRQCQAIYDELSDKLARPEVPTARTFRTLTTRDAVHDDDAADPLAHHAAIRASGWAGDVRPTFRPDRRRQPAAPGWGQARCPLIRGRGARSGTAAGLVSALEERRGFFRSMGAAATDHGVESAFTAPLAPTEAEAIFGVPCGVRRPRTTPGHLPGTC